MCIRDRCYAMRSLTAKNVCDALLELWQFTGCCSHISSDLGTNFTAQVTQEFEKRMQCVPRFKSPYHPQSTGLAERAVGNVKNIVSKLAMDHPKQWHTYLPMFMSCLWEVPNETTGVAPWTLVMGHLPRGPLAILKDSWCDQDLPISFGKNAQEYLRSSMISWRLPRRTPLPIVSGNKSCLLYTSPSPRD